MLSILTLIYIYRVSQKPLVLKNKSLDDSKCIYQRDWKKIIKKICQNFFSVEVSHVRPPNTLKLFFVCKMFYYFSQFWWRIYFLSFQDFFTKICLFDLYMYFFLYIIHFKLSVNLKTIFFERQNRQNPTIVKNVLKNNSWVILLLNY